MARCNGRPCSLYKNNKAAFSLPKVGLHNKVKIFHIIIKKYIYCNYDVVFLVTFINSYI